MFLKNKLTRYLSDQELARLIAVAADGLDLRDVLVEAGFVSGLDGEAAGLFRSAPYGWDLARFPEARLYVRAGFPRGQDLIAAHHPCSASPTPAGPGCNHLAYLPAYRPLPAVTLQDLAEELVYIYGHEFTHVAQWRADQAAGWTLYQRADGSHDADRLEHEAEAAGQARLGAFRRQRG